MSAVWRVCNRATARSARRSWSHATAMPAAPSSMTAAAVRTVAVTGFRLAHLTAASAGPTRRAVMARPSRNARRSAASAAAVG